MKAEKRIAKKAKTSPKTAYAVFSGNTLASSGDTIEIRNESGSTLYTDKELYDAMLAVKCQFAAFAGCELHSIRYGGDEANTQENIKWVNELAEGKNFTQVCEILTDFHSPTEPYGAWETDKEYKDWQWWLARTEGGDWQLLTWGY